MTLFGIIHIGKLGRAARFPQQPRNLAELNPGQKARVTGFSARMAPDRKTHLQAYGVTPGRIVRLSQHKPVAVLLVEQTELALELELAREVEIEVTGL